MNKVLQFKISLVDTMPEVWRRIQILENSTFWDLHVAIQCSMGWKDCHLHRFIVYDGNLNNKKTKQPIFLGIPDEENEMIGGNIIIAGWEVKLTDYLFNNKTFGYEYDFGDNWEHYIEFEAIYEQSSDIKKYPICLAGENACPPEDVGGIGGFYDYVEVITDKNHPDYEDALAWNGKYNPTKFDLKKVKFLDSKRRLNQFLKEI
jgi:hypothetical protein